MFRLLPPRMPGKLPSLLAHAAYAVLLILKPTRLNNLKAGLSDHVVAPQAAHAHSHG